MNVSFGFQSSVSCFVVFKTKQKKKNLTVFSLCFVLWNFVLVLRVFCVLCFVTRTALRWSNVCVCRGRGPDSNQHLITLSHSGNMKKKEMFSLSTWTNTSSDESMHSSARMANQLQSGSNLNLHHFHQQLPPPSRPCFLYHLPCLQLCHSYGTFCGLCPCWWKWMGLYMLECCCCSAPRVRSNWQELAHMELINSRLLAH